MVIPVNLLFIYHYYLLFIVNLYRITSKKSEIVDTYTTLGYIWITSIIDIINQRLVNVYKYLLVLNKLSLLYYCCNYDL